MGISSKVHLEAPLGVKETISIGLVIATHLEDGSTFSKERRTKTVNTNDIEKLVSISAVSSKSGELLRVERRYRKVGFKRLR